MTPRANDAIAKRVTRNAPPPKAPRTTQNVGTLNTLSAPVCVAIPPTGGSGNAMQGNAIWTTQNNGTLNTTPAPVCVAMPPTSVTGNPIQSNTPRTAQNVGSLNTIPAPTGGGGNPVQGMQSSAPVGEGNLFLDPNLHVVAQNTHVHQQYNVGQRGYNSLDSTPVTLCNLATANYTHNIPQATRSVDDDISLHVSPPIKEKIVNGDYIDLGILLTNSTNHTSQKQNIIFNQGQLTIEPVKANKITNIETWTDAMLIYISIYCSVHVTKYPELIKYMNSIRLGAKRCQGNGWSLYDQQYRLKKARDPTTSWGSIDTELWLIYMQPQAQTAQYTRAQNYKCYAFNYEGYCTKTGCYYQHSCIRCNNAHPVKHCQYEKQATPTPRPLLPVNTQPAQRYMYTSNVGSFRGTQRPTVNRQNFRPQSSFRGSMPRYMGPR